MTNYSKTMRKYRVTDDVNRSRVEVHTFSPCKSSSSSTNSCLGCFACLAWVVAVFFMALFFLQTTRNNYPAGTTTTTNTRYAFVPVQWIFHDDINNYREGGVPVYGVPAANAVCVGDQLVAGQLFPPFLLQPLDVTTTRTHNNNNNKHLHRVLRVHSEDCETSPSYVPKKRSAENVSANEVLYRHKSIDTLPPPLGLKLINVPNNYEVAGDNFSCCQSSSTRIQVRMKNDILETRKSRDLNLPTEMLRESTKTSGGAAAGLNEFQAQLLSFLQTRNSKESENETLSLLKNKFQSELTGILNLLAMNRVKFSSTSSATSRNSSATEDPDLGTSSVRKSRSWTGNSSVSSSGSSSTSAGAWIWPSSTETKRKDIITTKKIMAKPDWSFLVADYKVTFKDGPNAKPNYSTVKVTKKIPPWLLT